MRATRLIILLFMIIAGQNQAEAGPVIIDGTDANEHGEFSDGRNKEGWLYMQKALEALSIQISSNARRVVVVLGTFRGSQARDAIASAFEHSSLNKAGPNKWDIEYIEGPQAINIFLNNITIDKAGILHIPTFNETPGDLTPVEMAVINAHGREIASFVNEPGVKDEGGALFAMAESGVDTKGKTAYTWLKSLIPGIKIIDLGILGFDSSIKLTTDGTASLLQLTKEEDNDIKEESDEIEAARPWHNYFEFEGDPGALKVFATAIDRSNTTRDVALGGAIADLSISKSASPDPISPGSTITYNITVTNKGPSSASSVKVTDKLPASIMLLSCSASDGGTCDGAGKITFSSLSANTTATIVIKALVSCPPDGVLTISNMVNVDSATFELTPDNNLAVLPTIITGDSEAKIDMRLQQSEPVAARNKFKPKKSRLGVFTIENLGCAPLTFNLESIKRSEADVNEAKIGDADDRAFFPINVINADGMETPIMVGDSSAQFTIAANQGSLGFRVLFHPKIPAFRNQSSGLPSTFILPCKFAATLSISDNRGVLRAITLPGDIKPAVTLIEPVRLFRSGDELTVEFTVHDCDPRDVRSVRYEFLDQNGKIIGSPFTLEDELRNAIEREINEDRLQPGQSFRGTKTFLSVKNSGDVTVRVTVNGLSGSSDTDTSGAQDSSTNSSATRSLHTQGASVFLPSAKLMSNKTGSAKNRPKRKER